MGVKITSDRTMTLVVVLFFISILLPLTLTQDITVTQIEGQPSGSFVVSISTSPNILNLVGESDRASLQYSILAEGFENSQYFVIDRTSGNITFNGIVDREKICPFSDDCSVSFSVAVRGANNFFSTFTVQVYITDKNDNSPVFQDQTITVHILESENPSDFSRPIATATDADRSTRYSINDYSIVPESPIFDIEFRTNIIGTPQVNLKLKEKLDREDEGFYTVEVVASDGDTPPRTGRMRVDIVVDDVNDNDPQFSQTFYTANFSENMGPGYLIIRVSATDDDSGENGRVSYSLSSTPNTNIGVADKISVNSTTGQIFLLHALSSGLYDILIDAHDNGIPSKSAQAVVKVNVLDTSNNKPVVTVNAVQLGDLPLGYVSEMEQPSAVVAVVNVDDPDSGKNGNVTCETSEPHFQLQQLQAGSFKLMVAKPLDREQNETLDVYMTCKDQGTPSLNDTALITIRLADENDNNPSFTKPVFVQNIVENNIAGDTVTFVNAFDLDEGDNAFIEYQLEHDHGDFLVTPDSGVIKAVRSFDREDKSRYEFKILAIDHGSPRRTGTATMIVNIKDINDVPPTFTKETYKLNLYENRDPNTIVGNVSVSDPDEGDGGVVSLNLSPVRQGEVVPFEIDTQGRITSLYKFDREVQERYSFYVIGKDNGQRQLSSSALVIVDILDINDNKPSFMFPTDQNDSAFVNIPIKMDQVISEVNAHDFDIKQNAIVTYSIVSSNSSDLFRIGKFSGEIISNKDLGSNDMGTFSITVNATDQGFPVLWQVMALNIVVQSESTKRSGVIADQNVLIVACIICFTVIVSGAVMVAMCVLRRMDRQKKMQYAATHSDTRPDSEQGSLPDHSQQYDLAQTPGKHDHPHQEKGPSPYHQQTGHPHFLPNGNHSNNVNNNSNNKRGSNSHTRNNGGGFIPKHQQQLQQGDNSSSFRSEPPPFYLIGPNGKIPDTNPHRHDDFQSTSSTETTTGDSGHGSDEDLSNSIDQSNAPTVSMEPSTNLSMLGRSNRTSSSDNASIQSKLLLPPSKNRPPSTSSASGKQQVPKNKGNSVRFDPCVTDIYDNKNKDMGEFHARLYFTGGNSGSTNSIKDNNTTGPMHPPNKLPQKSVQIHPQQPFRQTMPYCKQDGHFDYRDSKSKSLLPSSSTTSHQRHNNQHQSKYNPNPSNSLRLHSMSPQHRHNSNVSSILTPSSNFSIDDANDESDLNTTTSGSYSVASDDVAREASLMMSNDMYV